MKRIYATSDEVRNDTADQLAAIIWDLHVELMRINPFLVPSVCARHGVDFDFRKAS